MEQNIIEKIEIITVKILTKFQKFVTHSREVRKALQMRRTGIFRPGLHW